MKRQLPTTIYMMVLCRLLTGSLELIAAILMWCSGKITSALKINAFLGFVGPVVLIITNALALRALSSELPLQKLLIIALGVLLIFWGATS